MSVIMSSLMGLLNRLLPFATPGTPVYQDVVHLGLLAVLLYYAPQIQQHLEQRRQGATEQEGRQILDEPAIPENEAFRQPGVDDVIEPENDHVRHLPGGNEGAHDENNNDQMPPLRDHAPADPPVEAGPANPAAARVPPQHRNIGAKKAKSLAKKDQRRAYHEFQRSQGDVQRARDAEGAAEREAAQAAEQARRKANEAKLEEKKAKEREKRREQERRQREEEIQRRERAVRIVREELGESRMCNLFDVARDVGGDHDDVSLEKVLNAAGVLGKGADGALTMVTSTGWIVRVSEDDMRRAYATTASTFEGDISYEQLGKILQQVLKEKD